ncbi:MAG: cytochrome P450 [Candidatus Marinimicrobia bacterium TMED108]|nr:MAG: cytochrome P450 [Candidatus Marinimicrobia bacterium TMED108]
MTPEYEVDPNPILDNIRENHPIYFHEGLDSWVLSRHEDILEALRNPSFTTENYAWQLEPVHGKNILQMEGSDHRSMRAIVTPTLRGDQLRENFESVAEHNAKELIDVWRYDGNVELVSQFTLRLPLSVIIDVLGLDAEDKPKFHVWYNAIHDYFTNTAGDPEVEAAGLRTHDELKAFLMPLIQERKMNPGEDLISKIVHAEIDGERMSDIDIKSYISFLLVAGSESTDLQMANMWMRLLENPEQLKAVREDRSLIRTAFAEALRHTPAVLMIMREASEDVEFHGVTIPAGATVTLMLAAANRDPRKFSAPETFNIFRDDLETEKEYTAAANHMTFALGRHFCIGTYLAVMEAEIATNLLLDAMGDIAFSNSKSPKQLGSFVRAPRHMPLTFTPIS